MGTDGHNYCVAMKNGMVFKVNKELVKNKKYIKVGNYLKSEGLGFIAIKDNIQALGLIVKITYIKLPTFLLRIIGKFAPILIIKNIDFEVIREGVLDD